MRTRLPCAWRLLAPAALLLLLAGAPFAAADESGEDPAADPAAPTEGTTAIPDEEAGELAAQLAKVQGRKKPSEVVPVLEAIGLRSHPSLHKSLVKLLTHPSEEVALRAADILAVQRCEKERDRVKLAKSVWKAGFSQRKNAHRYNLKGRVVRVSTGMSGKKLDARQLRDVEKLWRYVIDTSSAKGYAPGIVDVCRYVKATGDKRFARMLAEQIEQPQPADINSPTNPPASYWKKRYELWKEINAEAVEALEKLTGKSFKTLADAKAWIREHRKEGFDW